MSRTYFRGDRRYAHVYHEYGYHDRRYYRYVPGYYYNRRFYGWAVNPWGPHVYYTWGGGFTAPWFGYYNGYFTPYPFYDSPNFWLTDYLIAENIRLAYENEQAANPDQPPPPHADSDQSAVPLSPEVKAQIANEVKQQLAEEQAAAAKPEGAITQSTPGGEETPAALDPKQPIFVVSSNLGVATADGQECQLTPGDVIERTDETLGNDNTVPARVLNSKQNDCSQGAKFRVAVDDLQDMHNSFREQLDSGLKTLAENQAKGLPNAPAPGQRAVPEGTADPDPQAASQLEAQENQAANLEAQVTQGGNSN